MKPNLKLIILVLLLAVPSTIAVSRIYRAKHAETRLISSEYHQPPHEVERILTVVKRESERVGLPYKRVLAVIATESSFNPLAVSKKGAVGLMQIHKSSGKPLTFDVEANIITGVEHLAGYIGRFGDKKGLAAYNAGSPRSKAGLRYAKKVERIEKWL